MQTTITYSGSARESASPGVMPGCGARLKPLALALGLLTPLAAAASQYEFDDSMLVGSAGQQSLARFNRAHTVAPGDYQVDIFINGAFLSRQTLRFAALPGQDAVVPCFSRDALIAAGILPDSIKSRAARRPPMPVCLWSSRSLAPAAALILPVCGWMCPCRRR
ncbi:Outer membrane usher protein fimD precursor [Serratia rubidaea]|uniref:Outer membrane usher protein fimD n=1 Tax=Serratia rubidaea TaxID=61652 RepID=A0A4U9HC88_SERRU|nr:Outer membrane usher protein fimD precursor [Serratia rubidaea]